MGLERSTGVQGASNSSARGTPDHAGHGAVDASDSNEGKLPEGKDAISACKQLLAVDSVGDQAMSQLLGSLQKCCSPIDAMQPDEIAHVMLVTLIRQLRRVFVRDTCINGILNVYPWLTIESAGSAQLAVSRKPCAPFDPTLGDCVLLTGISLGSLDVTGSISAGDNALNELIHGPSEQLRAIPESVPAGTAAPWVGASCGMHGGEGLHRIIRECCAAIWASLHFSSAAADIVSTDTVPRAIATVLRPCGQQCAEAYELLHRAPDELQEEPADSKAKGSTSRRSRGPRFEFHDKSVFSFPSSGLTSDRPSAAFDRFRKTHYSHFRGSGAASKETDAGLGGIDFDAFPPFSGHRRRLYDETAP